MKTISRFYSILILLTFSFLLLVAGCKDREISETFHTTDTRKSTENLSELTSIPSTQTPIQSTNTPTVTPIPTVNTINKMVSEKDGMVLVYVPEGEFKMGAEQSVGVKACQEIWQKFDQDVNCFEYFFDDEFPVHSVYIDAFWIDQTEITNSMYAEFLNIHGNKSEWGVPWMDESDPNNRIIKQDENWIVENGYEDHPVTLVTWYGANAYCLWMGRRLPTEAEWEKAARGTDERIFPWGNEFDGSKLNYRDISSGYPGANPNIDDGYKFTAPVGNYPLGASPYGVLDMAGNVSEWVFDRYDRDYYSHSPYENPDGPAESFFEIRVARGGSWVSPGSVTRTTHRFSTHLPAYEEIDTGFRCVINE